MRLILGSFAVMFLIANTCHVEAVRDGERKGDDDHLSISTLLYQV